MSIHKSILAVAAVGLVLAAVPLAQAAAPPAPGLPDLVSSSDSGSSPLDNITSDSTPSFTIDAGAAQAGMTVTLYFQTGTQAAQSAGSAIVPASGVVSMTASSQGDGTWNVTAKTTNSGAETSQPSGALSVQIDTSVPLLLSAPVLHDFVGAVPTVTFTSTPRFDVVAETDLIVQLYEGTTSLGTGTSVGGNALVAVSTPLSDGIHVVHAIGTDLAGNNSASSPTTSITIDTTAPTATKPDLLATDDDGGSTTDNVTSKARPRFAVSTEQGARVTIFENGLALGSAIAGAGGIANVQVNDVLWLDPGVHCVYAVAQDVLGNSGIETAELCVTIEPGEAPFTSNLGVKLDGGYLLLSFRPAVAARATVRVIRGLRTLRTVRVALSPGKLARVRVHLPPHAQNVKRLVVLATLARPDGTRLLVRRVLRPAA